MGICGHDETPPSLDRNQPGQCALDDSIFNLDDVGSSSSTDWKQILEELVQELEQTGPAGNNDVKAWTSPFEMVGTPTTKLESIQESVQNDHHYIRREEEGPPNTCYFMTTESDSTSQPPSIISCDDFDVPTIEIVATNCDESSDDVVMICDEITDCNTVFNNDIPSSPNNINMTTTTFDYLSFPDQRKFSAASPCGSSTSSSSDDSGCHTEDSGAEDANNPIFSDSEWNEDFDVLFPTLQGLAC
jgi:hypothetical protein